ncbi:hypothetical protein CLV89_12115 [Tritonibacter scottomollicae]|uniref:Uncharacterized protein n=1 Tax=Tritonibacter scottomollicae TaxID=483013 RepID=A0A2T1A7U4_TRISK|nr:hypothetical protein CLV89_12115 [Tritonibacter scottomollicae]
MVQDTSFPEFYSDMMEGHGDRWIGDTLANPPSSLS